MLMFWELKSLAWINRSVDISVLCHSCIIRVMWITTLKLTLILKLLLPEKETEQLFRLKDKLIDQLNRHTEQTLIRRQLKHETSYETNPAWHETNARNNELWLYIFIYIYFFYQQMAQTKIFELLYVLLFHNKTWSDEGTCKWHGGTSVNQTLAFNFLFKRVFFHQKRTKTLTTMKILSR